jgi:hypothetical protein
MPRQQSHGKSEPQRARIVETERGREARSPKKNHLLGVFNDQGQFIIKRGDELVLVEVPTA